MTFLRHMLYVWKVHRSWGCSAFLLTLFEILLSAILVANTFFHYDYVRREVSHDNLLPLYEWGYGQEEHWITPHGFASDPSDGGLAHVMLPDEMPYDFLTSNDEYVEENLDNYTVVLWLAFSSELLNEMPSARDWLLQELYIAYPTVYFAEWESADKMVQTINSPPDNGDFGSKRRWWQFLSATQGAMLFTLDPTTQGLGYTLFDPHADETRLFSSPELKGNFANLYWPNQPWQRSPSTFVYYNSHLLSGLAAVESVISRALLNISQTVNVVVERHGRPANYSRSEMVEANVIFSGLLPTFSSVTAFLYMLSAVRMSASLVSLRVSGTQRYLETNGMSPASFYVSFALTMLLPRLILAPAICLTMSILLDVPDPRIGTLLGLNLIYIVSLVPYTTLISLLSNSQLSCWFTGFGVYLFSVLGGAAMSGFGYWQILPPLPPCTFVLALTAYMQEVMHSVGRGYTLMPDNPDSTAFFPIFLVEIVILTALSALLRQCRLTPWFFLDRQYWANACRSRQVEDWTGLAARGISVSFNREADVVSDVALDVPVGAKLALLGHNGAGKTSFLRAATGSLGFKMGGDLRLCGLSPEEACRRGLVGYCPQEEVLPDLSVIELLEMMACFRGVELREVTAHCEAAAQKFSLHDLRAVRLKDVSLGVRRKVAVAAAFIGHPRVVILDEPTAGLDPRSRKETWQVARAHKNSAVIFTTHLLDEASFGDRIAIMHRGYLRRDCIGTMSELKKRFRCGHRLTIVKKHSGVADGPILDFVHRRISTPQHVPAAGRRELTLALPHSLDEEGLDDGFCSFGGLLAELHEDSVCAKLGVESFSLHTAGLEEIMVQTDPLLAATAGLGGLEDDPFERDSGGDAAAAAAAAAATTTTPVGSYGESSEMRQLDVLSEPLIPGSETRPWAANNDTFGSRLESSSLGTTMRVSMSGGPDHMPPALTKRAAFLTWWRQVWVILMYMRLPSIIRSYWFLVVQVALPLAVLVPSLPFVHVRKYEALHTTLRPELCFPDPVSTVPITGATVNWQGEVAAEMFHRLATEHNVSFPLSTYLQTGTTAPYNGSEPVPFWLQLHDMRFEDDYATQNLTLKTYFNASVFHSLPFVINYVHNVGRAAAGHMPVTGSIGSFPYIEQASVLFAFYGNLLFFALALCLVPCVCAARLVEERQSGARHLTQLCGVYGTTAYLACGLADCIVVYLIDWVLFLYVSIYMPSLHSATLLPCFAMYMMVYTPSIIVCNYAFSYAFENTLFVIVFCTFYHFTVCALCIDYYIFPDIAKTLECLSPVANFVNLLIYLQNISTELSTDVLRKPDVTSLELFAPHIATAATHLVFWSIILMFCDSRNTIKNALRRCFPRPTGFYEREAGLADVPQDSSVHEERRAVARATRATPRLPGEDELAPLAGGSESESSAHDSHALIVNQLRKVFKKKVAVSGMYLLLQPGDCFGLLSPSGSGGSTLLKMVAGLLSPSQGEVRTRGLSNLSAQQRKEMQTLVGYLPQTDALQQNMTVYSVLRYYALLKGLPDVTRETIEGLLSYLGLLSLSNALCGQLSGGKKRLLSLAIALLGNPPVLLLDMPTTAMDPATRETAWNLISNRMASPDRPGGDETRPIIFLTTNSVREADAVCTRFGVMVEGHLTTIGTPKQLKDRFARGYVVSVFFAPPVWNVADKEGVWKRIQNCSDSLLRDVRSVAPGAEMTGTGTGGTKVELLLPSDADVAQVIVTLEAKKAQYRIDEFSVAKASFEQAYLKQVEQQMQANLRAGARVPNVPPLRICILVVGSRGDVQPFIALAKQLQAHGHVIRIATHGCFKGFVEKNGIDYACIGGDPEKLIRFMVENPNMITANIRQVQEKRAIMSEIFRGCWRAAKSFRADVLVANPPVHVHTHIAEALHIPLQVHFTMPWSPTKAYCHPLAVVAALGNEQSYTIVEELMWLGLSDIVQGFRTSIGLPKLQVTGAGLQNALKIPHVYCVSPSLVPKPSDWGSHIAVTGFWFLDDVGGSGGGAAVSATATATVAAVAATASGAVCGALPPPQHQQAVALPLPLSPAPAGYEPPAELASFVEAGGAPPIYIGFGSIVIPDKKAFEATVLAGLELLRESVEVARGTATAEGGGEMPGRRGSEGGGTVLDGLGAIRVVLHSGWANLWGGKSVPPYAFVLKQAVSHDWLFPKCVAVVHHGGAGTTAAGLRAGKPTVVIPFFGDQTFWGKACERQGVGPPPINRRDLTTQNFCAAVRFALRPSVVREALDLGSIISTEAGLEKGVKAFHTFLPVGYDGAWRVSCFENQRWFPIVGWSEALRKGDPSQFSDATGSQFCDRERYPCPAGWAWDGEWEPVLAPDRDEQGFQYSANFFGTSWKKSQSPTDTVRRREWVRTRRYTPATNGGVAANAASVDFCAAGGGSGGAPHGVPQQRTSDGGATYSEKEPSLLYHSAASAVPSDVADELERLRCENALLRKQLDMTIDRDEGGAGASSSAPAALGRLTVPRSTGGGGGGGARVGKSHTANAQ
eukprot:Rhum_TRINITY_DN14764_c20_g1::Rhum_TRINITY_DN14764_c20_g1_i1::g.116186::m.116186